MAFDLESLSEATSGAIGALVSTTVLYPLDTCKNKYQAEVRSHNRQKYRKIPDVYWEAISNHQVLSLYQGLGTKNLQSFIFQFIYFYGYSFFKKLYLKKSGLKSIDTKANLVLAAAAGACTVIVTQPLDTASSRMQTSEFGKSKGHWKTLSEGTWSEAFDALGISLLLTTNPSIQYTVFDQLKQRLQRGQLSKKLGTESSSDSLSAVSAFVLGAVSKCIATCLTYPAISMGDDSGCRIRRRQEEGSSTEILKNSIRCNANDLEKGRATWFLQRIRCSDFEDCVKLCIAFDGEGEDHKNHLGSIACTPKLSVHSQDQIKECLDGEFYPKDHLQIKTPFKVPPLVN
ncbi:unnamed protein product [Camellia sinensis]